jgi:uncharacterized PurR-regulated membrane protein YhhQ (DUF165 family)
VLDGHLSCDSIEVNPRTLLAVILAITLALTLLFIVVIPGVDRGGWTEIAGVFVFVAVFAVGDRWLRRFNRRR